MRSVLTPGLDDGTLAVYDLRKDEKELKEVVRISYRKRKTSVKFGLAVTVLAMEGSKIAYGTNDKSCGSLPD